MKLTKARKTFLVMFAIILVWILAYPASMFLPNEVFQEPFGSIYNGLNVLFTALAFGGVALTLLFQAEESANARREEIERSIFELFQTFTSLEFQHVKDSAFRALLAAVQNRDYAEYLASRLFVVEQRAFPESAIETVRALDEKKKELNPEQVIHADRADRLMLDNILNFFALLAQRETSATVIKHCDFAYDWWRPTLWLIAERQEAHYNASPIVQQYCKTLLLKHTLIALDKVYEHRPLGNSAGIWAYICGHPKMQAFGLDERFRALEHAAR